MIEQLGVGVAVFTATNIDDLLLLAALFSDPRLGPRTVAAGQFIGIGLLVAASGIVARFAVAVPEGWPAILGIVPLGLGLSGLIAMRRPAGMSSDAEDARTRAAGESIARRTGSRMIAVAAVTVANGGDNLGAYVPLFAGAAREIPVYLAVFAAMTALWCWIARRLAGNDVAGGRVRRFGRASLPVVLIALGLYILSDARAIF